MQAQTSESEVEAVETIRRGKISDEEIRSYERALAEFQKWGDEREAAKILRKRGILYHKRGEWDCANLSTTRKTWRFYDI